MSARELITDHLDLWTGAVTQKRSGGRGNNGKIELTGIKKLRELILELAVRGKLVEQDPGDEPASVLLERIAEERALLVKDGKIKKPKTLPRVTADDVEATLPSGWQPTRLGELLERISNGFSGKQNKSGEGYALTRIETISDGTVNIEKVGHSPEVPKEKVDYFKLRENDILLSHINSDYHVGKTAIVPEGVDLLHGVNLLLLRPSKLVQTSYINIVINELRLSGYFLNIAQHAIGQASINQGKVNNIIVPLPPEAEQCRIVEKVDELMALCDRLEQQVGDQLEAHDVLVDTLLDALTRSTDAAEVADNWARIAEHFDTLFTTEASIDRLEQTILQLAVMGRLAPQDEREESAQILLEKIAFRTTAANTKRQKTLEPISDEEIPFCIPRKWEWARLGEISRIVGGFAFKSSDYSQSGVRVIRISDFDEKGFKSESIVRHAYADSLADFRLQPESILMAMTGGTVGKSYLVKSLPEPMMVNQRVACIKIAPEVKSEYIYALLKTDVVRDIIEEAKNSTNDNISMKDIKNFIVPLPPCEEQSRIIEKVDELMALCDQLKVRLSETSETRTHLAEAVVEQAVQ